MTTKHLKEKYREKQMRFAARSIEGAYENIRTDSKIAKEKARPHLTQENISIPEEESHFIQEFIAARKRRKEPTKK